MSLWQLSHSSKWVIPHIFVCWLEETFKSLPCSKRGERIWECLICFPSWPPQFSLLSDCLWGCFSLLGCRACLLLLENLCAANQCASCAISHAWNALSLGENLSFLSQMTPHFCLLLPSPGREVSFPQSTSFPLFWSCLLLMSVSCRPITFFFPRR